MSRLVDEIRRSTEPFRLAGPGLVAVSGGADSVALVRGLLDAGLTGLTVGHFNHRLRGADSDADEAFVRDLAGRLGVPFVAGVADVAEIAAERGQNLEATARELRYGWLTATARHLHTRWVATGHTADDQAETVLHRLIRGTGLAGLRGIAGGRLLGEDIELHRPLLRVTRAEVLDYLRSLGQPFREDASNADPTFTRNRIRAELLPLLKTFNPAVVTVLNRLADQAEQATALLHQAAGAGLRQAELPRAGNLLVLDRLKLLPLGEYLIAEVMRLVWQREGWPTGGMTADHWDRLVAIIRDGPPAADFPGGVSARRVERVVQLGRRS